MANDMKLIKYTFFIVLAINSVLLCNNNYCNSPGDSTNSDIPKAGIQNGLSRHTFNEEPGSGLLGGIYGHCHIPENLLQQIDFLEAEGRDEEVNSVTTFNMITNVPVSNNSRLVYLNRGLGDRFDRLISASAELVTDVGDAGVFIFGSTRERPFYDRNQDGFSEISAISSESICVNGFFKPSNRSEFQISLYKMVDEERAGSMHDIFVHESKLSEWTNKNKFGGRLRIVHAFNSSIGLTGSYSFSKQKNNSFYGGLLEDSPAARIDALTCYGFTEVMFNSGGVKFHWVTNKLTTTAGVQYDEDIVEDKSVASTDYHFNQKFTNLGLFLQESLVSGDNDDLKISAMVRFDRHSSLENWLVSSYITVMYKLSEVIKLKADYITSVRTPRVFDEVRLLSGPGGTQRVLRNKEGLKAESSSTFSLGIELTNFMGETPVQLCISGSYTNQYSGFVDNYGFTSGRFEYWERVNSEDATASGLTFALNVKPFSGFSVQSSFTLNSNPRKEDVENFNSRDCTSDIFGDLNLSLNITENLLLFTSARYTGCLQIPRAIFEEAGVTTGYELIDSRDFLEFDFALSFQFNFFRDMKTELSLGVKNLTDTFQENIGIGFMKDPGFVYGPREPRNFFFMVKMDI